jgi:glycosyltransferase involved in cell wall biosynthesis
VEAQALVHCYNEPIPESPPVEDDFAKTDLSLFFSGMVYDINAASLGRIIRAAGRAGGVRVSIFGPNPKETLERNSLLAAHVQTGFMSRRSDLLACLAAQDVLVACLSWPDESWVGVKELSTIFSTKLPEYFAQGRPVLIHCPDDYFMAQFAREHDCAWVVSERSEEAIVRTIEQIRNDVVLRRRRNENALKTARLFAGDRVSLEFRRALEQSLWMR